MPPAPPTAVRRLHRGTEEEDATQLKLGILPTTLHTEVHADRVF